VLPGERTSTLITSRRDSQTRPSGAPPLAGHVCLHLVWRVGEPERSSWVGEGERPAGTRRTEGCWTPKLEFLERLLEAVRVRGVGPQNHVVRSAAGHRSRADDDSGWESPREAIPKRRPKTETERRGMNSVRANPRTSERSLLGRNFSPTPLRNAQPDYVHMSSEEKRVHFLAPERIVEQADALATCAIIRRVRTARPPDRRRRTD